MSAKEPDPLAPPVDREVEDELQRHLELRAREYEQQGLAPDAARRAAQRRFGDVESVRRQCRELARERNRDRRRREWRSETRQDLRFAVRQIRRQPAFSLTAVLTLALGIGATTTIFAAVHAVLVRPFAYRAISCAGWSVRVSAWSRWGWPRARSARCCASSSA
jgi:putative ABC transport system permease protein